MSKMILRYNSEYDDLAPVMAVSETDAEAAFRSHVKERAVALLDISDEEAEELLESGGDAEEGLTYCRETGAATILRRNGECEVLRLTNMPVLPADGALETAGKMAKEAISQFSFKTPEEILMGRDEHNMVRGYVSIHLSDVIDNDYEGFLDTISEDLVGSDLLMGTDYKIVGLDNDFPNSLIIEVSGDASDVLKAEGMPSGRWSYEVCDKESGTVLFSDGGFGTEKDAECQAGMEANAKNVKNYSIFTFQAPDEG